MTTAAETPIVIVGAGLAGLSCGRALVDHGLPCLILEASDRVGGRVASDEVDGFVLDRGFQVLLTSYPEAQRVLDMDTLRLGRFEPGALVQLAARRHRLVDPWRRPLGALRSPGLAALTAGDMIRMVRLRRRALSASRSGRVVGANQTTAAYLREQGFSRRALDRFLVPFFGGVFLDRELRTDRGMFDFVFGMFARGSAALPAGGMQAIPRQLAASLPAGSIRLRTRVSRIDPDGVSTDDGERIAARCTVLATDLTTAARLHGGLADRPWRGATAVYYAAEAAPVDAPLLVLDGTGEGPVNHLCVPSSVAAGYAPPGAALVSATIIGVPDRDDAALDESVRRQLTGWFGTAVSGWRHLRTCRVAHALPALSGAGPGAARLSPGLYACGDHLEDPSINGALASGRRTAEAIVDDDRCAAPGPRLEARGTGNGARRQGERH